LHFTSIGVSVSCQSGRQGVMKQSLRLVCAVAVSLGIGLWASTVTQAGMMVGSVGYHSGYSGASRSSFSAGYYGGYRGGYYGGYRGGYYGGYHGGYYGYGRNSVALSFSFGYGGPAYYGYGYYPSAYYYPPAYYSAPVYYSTPVVYTAPASSPTTYSDSAPAPTVVQTPTPTPPSNEGQPMRPADVIALVKSGLSDDVITSQIRSSRMVFHLSTAEIIDLKNNGVSDKVINFMINTATS
jgi:hypothetical protein